MANLKLHKFNPMLMENKRLKGNPPTSVFIGKRGSGKCLSKNEHVIMFDGNLKAAQDVRVGDQLMGDDSKPRNVVAISSGVSQLYKVKQTQGDDYVVNDNHVLSLKVVKTNTIGRPINLMGKKLFRDDVLDIPVLDFMKLSKTTRYANLKGYKVPVRFTNKNVPIDPYILGLWLGDGTSARAVITNQDSTIIKYLITNVGKYNCYLDYKESQRKYTEYQYVITTTEDKNQFWESIKSMGLRNNKHIPHVYKCNDRLYSIGCFGWSNRYRWLFKIYEKCIRNNPKK